MAYSDTSFGLGGGCTAAGVPVYGAPDTYITSPANVGQLFRTTVTAGARAGGGGGSRPEPGGGCEVFIGQVTTPPTNGYGMGTVKKVTFNSDGSWTASGENVTVIFPRI